MSGLHRLSELVDVLQQMLAEEGDLMVDVEGPEDDDGVRTVFQVDEVVAADDMAGPRFVSLMLDHPRR